MATMRPSSSKTNVIPQPYVGTVERKALKGKVRNLQLNNLLYGYQNYTDDQALKKMVGLPATSPNEELPPHRPENQDPQPIISRNKESKEAEREVALVITMTSKEHPLKQTTAPQLHYPTRDTSRDTPVVHPVQYPTGTPKERYDKFSNRLDAAINKVRSEPPRPVQYRPILPQEPSYTHMGPVAPPVAFVRDASFKDDQKRLASVLPPILLQGSSSGRVFAARSSSIEEERPARPSSSRQQKSNWMQTDKRNAPLETEV